MSQDMHLDVYNTHIELYPYEKDDCPVIEDDFTAEDKMSGDPFPCGYLIDGGKLYLARGASVSKIEYLMNVKAKYVMEPDEYESMHRKHYSNFDPRDKLQEDSIRFLTESGPQSGLLLKTGVGKCEPLSTHIPTPDGWKRFGDLQPGDTVYSEFNKTTKILSIHPQGVKPIYRITFTNGRYVDCGLEHLWRIGVIKDETELVYIETVETSQIIEYLKYGNLVAIPMYDSDIRYPAEYDISNLGNQSYRQIQSVEYNRDEEAMCIYVDEQSHLYVTDQMIITHNTFCVAYASTKLNDKTMIICPNDSIKNQWIKTYTSMMDYRKEDVLNISGSNIIEGLMDDLIKPADVYVVNHQTLRSYLSATNPYKFHEFFKKIKVGIKVYDEAHLNYENILLIDFFSNTNRTWYLTATFDRSSKTESVCFKKAFSTVVTFGEKESKEVARKHVIYHVVNINSRITPQNRAKVLRYPGFAQPVDTLIPLADGGCKRLGDLRIGDMILDRLGNPTAVTNIYDHPNEESYEITFSDGRKSICSAEHLWYVKRLTWKYSERMEAMKLIDIIKDYKIDYSSMPNRSSTQCVYNYQIPVNRSVRYPHKDVPVDPYILGALIGDGYLNDEYLNIGNSENTPKEGIVRYIEQVTGFKASFSKSQLAVCHFIGSDSHLVKTNDFLIGCTSGLVSCKSQYKYIPNEYIYNDEETRWSILQGLMDTDGRIKIKEFPHACYKSIEYTSTSKRLLDDIRTICWSLGLGCGYTVDPRDYKYSLGYAGVVTIQIDNHLVTKLFRCNSAKVMKACVVSGYPDYKNRSMATILDIKKLNRKMDMKCITVDNDEHLYLTNDYIVTHNTAIRYGEYAIFDDPNDTLYHTILSILDKTKDMEGKTLIFLPTIAAVDEVVKRLKKDVTRSVAPYHSKIPKDEKEAAEKKRIIVSTIKSCGTGRDIKGLRSIICAEPIASKVLIEQTIGRLRPYAEDKQTYYWDIVDTAIQPNIWWWKGRFKKIQTLVAEVVTFDMV